VLGYYRDGAKSWARKASSTEREKEDFILDGPSQLGAATAAEAGNLAFVVGPNGCWPHFESSDCCAYLPFEASAALGKMGSVAAVCCAVNEGPQWAVPAGATRSVG
jgi:hypothetical protein